MTDWPSLIAELERHLRHIDIAEYCGRGENWVGNLKRGVIRDPAHHQGVLLIELASKYGIETPYLTVGAGERA